MDEKKGLTPDERKRRASNAAKARWSKGANVLTDISCNNNELVSVMPSKGLTAGQGVFDLGIQKQVEVDGVGMGVLSDSTAFLTGRGLARLCGVDQKVISKLSSEWLDDTSNPRITRIKEILESHGAPVDRPYIAIEQRSGTFYAYPDVVCLAVLEYYAFDAKANVKDVAKKNYRLLAGKALRDLIYTQVGYDPTNSVPDAWKQFHDRLTLTYNSVPKGYFGVFKELSDMVVTLGQAGVHINESFVPDISVGSIWSSYWKSHELDKIHGERMKYEHNYPDYFPQALSNPQDSWCYPESALGEFRHWLRDVYIKEGKLINYIEGKVKKNELPISFTQLAISAYGLKQIE